MVWGIEGSPSSQSTGRFEARSRFSADLVPLSDTHAAENVGAGREVACVKRESP
jgi:hypothetical protein